METGVVFWDNIDTQVVSAESFALPIQILGVLMYCLIPTFIIIITAYFYRKHKRKRTTRNKKKTNSKEKAQKLDLNTSDTELKARIDATEQQGEVIQCNSLTLNFDKQGKIKHK